MELNEKVCNQMKLRFDYNNMMREFVGSEGLTHEQLEDSAKLCALAYETVQANRGKGMMGWSELPYNQDEIVEDIIATAENVRKNFKYFVVLGIGGSALGPIAVFNAMKHLHYNDLPDEKRNGPKFYVEDNVDPERMAALFDVIELDKTCFNVITKSGSTSETMSQYLIVWDTLKKAFGAELKIAELAGMIEEHDGVLELTGKGAFYFHYYEGFYTLAYIDKMWGLLRNAPFPVGMTL